MHSKHDTFHKLQKIKQKSFTPRFNSYLRVNFCNVLVDGRLINNNKVQISY